MAAEFLSMNGWGQIKSLAGVKKGRWLRAGWPSVVGGGQIMSATGSVLVG
jgi:hypothetical protein